MKFITTILLFSLSISSFAQANFKVPKDTGRIRSLKDTKENHLLILKTYKSQIDSELSRLLNGIEYESSKKGNTLEIRSYENLLVRLLIKRIFASELEKQLKAVDLDAVYAKYPPKLVFNTDKIKIDLSSQLNIHLDSVAKKDNTLGHYFISDLKSRLVKETIFKVAGATYKAIGTGLLTKLVTGGVSAAALKTAVLSMGSEIFVSAGTGAILSVLTLPLHAYRLPPEQIWLDILEEHPELLINPEWMRYAGSTDDPWFTHGYTIIRETKRMNKALSKLLNKEEAEFKKSVITISKLGQKKEESKQDSNPYRVAVDNTYVHRPIILQDYVPFWATKR